MVPPTLFSPIPPVRQFENFSRGGHCFQSIKKIENDAPLAGDMTRFAEHAAARELDVHDPGRFDALDPGAIIAN
jgi:hypothetical protein